MDEKIKGLKKLSAIFSFLLFAGPIILLLAGYLGFPEQYKLVLSGKFYSKEQFLIMPLVFLALAVFETIFVGWFLLAYKKRIENLEWLRVNGRMIETVVTSVEKVAYEHASYYMVESEWQKPENGQNYKFLEQVAQEPSGIIPGKSTVRVLINYENPKIYFVDLISIKS